MSGEPANLLTEDSPLAELLPVAARETHRRVVSMATIFMLIALSGLALGMLLPKRYTASTTILVEQSNIIAPLMEGRAVPTGVANRANIAREVALSRKVMAEILEVGGWMEKNPSPIEQDRLIEQIGNRTRFSSPRENLIQIVYTDADPRRAHAVTRAFAEHVIEESLTMKERESREAYEFIDAQVRQYHAKLTEAESNLERYRGENPDARPGVEGDVNARIRELRRQIENSRLDLMDLRSQEDALRAQLSGESEITTVQTRAGQFRVRLMELQSERDGLLLNYTALHPDVVRLEHQIRDLEQDLLREESRERLRASGPGEELSGAAAYNPLYAELRSKLAEASRRSAATASRIAAAEDLLEQERERNRQIAASESTLAELTRDYEVNRELYQDLLKRRENARVSMNLDAERQGLSFRIQEPAMVPLRPSGLRLLHVAGAGLMLACAVPMALLLAFVKLDPRVRSPKRIEDIGLPLLAVIPPYRSRRDRIAELRRYLVAGTLFASVPVAYGVVLSLKLVHVL